MTETKVCSGSVNPLVTLQPSKVNPGYYAMSAIQTTNPQLWGATYVPYDFPTRLYANEQLRPSFYDEGCFAAQCDLNTQNICTRVPNVDLGLQPNWNVKLDSLYVSRDAYGSSAKARQWAELHSQLAGSTVVPMSGMAPLPPALPAMPFKTSPADSFRPIVPCTNATC